MRQRHRPPNLVSMWMLDVFCCALGCVILLLLLKMRESSIIAEESAQVSSILDDTRLTLADVQEGSRVLTADVADRDATLLLLTQDRDEQAKNLALTRTERDALARKLALAEDTVKTTEAELALVRKNLDEMARKLALTQEKSTTTQADLATRSSEVAALSKKLTDLQKADDDLQRLIREKEKTRAELARQSLDLSDRLSAAEKRAGNADKRVTEMQKQIADASVTIVDLQGTKAKLADKIDKLTIESDQRFAGIAMTGKNVVFLVDMSGSMDRIDENTIDPAKWPTVRDTLLRLMRSLPDLSQYQVILFSSRVSYMLGSDGQWLTYERDKSIEQVRRAMTAIKPVGDTNLYNALEETFKFRAKGLDTVYLVSDGLPTSGPGLTPAEEKSLQNEQERGVVLAKHLRRTLRTTWNPPSDGRPRVRINAVGFFYESPDVGAFLWALARENDGSFVGMSRP